MRRRVCPGLAPRELVPEGLRPEPVEGGWEHRVLPGAGVTRREGRGTGAPFSGKGWKLGTAGSGCSSGAGPLAGSGVEEGKARGAGPSRRREPRLPTFRSLPWSVFTSPLQRPAQPVTPGLPPQAPPSLAGVPSPRLLLPEDFKGTRPGPGSDPAGVYRGPVNALRGGAPPGSSAHPGLSQEASRNQACSPVGTGHSDVEAELEGIRQQLQDYQTTRQNLRSCQRQAHSLRRWLELSREEPRAEDQEAEQQVQEELRKVEVQIQQLAHELQARRQPVHTCIARVQALRRALC